MDKVQKSERIHELYIKLMNGGSISSQEIVKKYGVDIRTAQRDIRNIKEYLKKSGDTATQMVYSKERKEYRFKDCKSALSNSEVLAVCKILLDSRAFPKEQMTKILNCIIKYCTNEKGIIESLILNEKHHYIETYHEYEYINKMWEIGKAIQQNKYIEVIYKRITGGEQFVKRKLKPIAILFSEYYFYVLALIDDKDIRKNMQSFDELSPTIYRIDRIQKLTILKDESFHTPTYGTCQSNIHLNEGEFRKRVQFMRGGKLRKVTFVYTGNDIHGVRDRLTTAEIISEKDGIYTIKAEVFGDGIDMWFSMHKNDVTEIKQGVM